MTPLASIILAGETCPILLGTGSSPREALAPSPPAAQQLARKAWAPAGQAPPHAAVQAAVSNWRATGASEWVAVAPLALTWRRPGMATKGDQVSEHARRVGMVGGRGPCPSLGCGGLRYPHVRESLLMGFCIFVRDLI